MNPNQTAGETGIRNVIERHPGIRLAILFGSLATGRGGRDSDVDLAIDAGQPLDSQTKMLLMEELAAETGRPVDLVDLRAVGEPLLGRILTRGRRIVGAPERYATFVTRHLLDEADFMPYYRRILRERRRRWIGK